MRKPFGNAEARESPPSSNLRASVLDYLFTVALCALALPLTLALPGAHSSPTFAFFLAAIAVSAWRGGWPTAVLAVVLAVTEEVYLVFPPVHIFIASPVLITRFAALMSLALGTALCEQVRPGVFSTQSCPAGSRNATLTGAWREMALAGEIS